MPEYKFTYFNITARGELPRLLFAAANVPYEDIRVSEEEWKEIKPKMPFGQIPVLEVDGKMLCQSVAISRYLARQFGFTGKNDWDQARADMIVDCLEDICKPLGHIWQEDREDKKKEKLQKYQDVEFPSFLARFEALLKENNGGDGFFVGDEMTYADIAFSHYITYPTSSYFKLTYNVDEFPKLKALKQRVDNNPGIAKWLKERPETNM